MTRRRVTGIALSLSLALAAVLATSAHASFHLMKIRELDPGTPAGMNGFMELQMTAAGQNLVVGQQVKVYNSAGTEISFFTIPGNAANGQNQRTILVGDANVPGSDFTYNGLGPALDAVRPGGAACFLGSNDCVSWGAFTGAALLPGPTGTPAPAIPPGQSLNRLITRNCATLLEEGDDPNNSAADFTLGAPSPRPNATPPTEVECKPTTPVAKKCKKRKKRGAKKSHEPSAAKKKKKRCGKKKKKR